MARLLYEAPSRGIAPGSPRRVLAAFPVAELEQADSLQTRTRIAPLALKRAVRA
jgi:hypothetical protein